MATSHHEPASRLRLPDGRRVSYRIYGAPDGIPVLALHGTPGAHLKYAVAHDVSVQLGLKLIAVDRWGYGETEVHRKPSLAAFADDMQAAADALQLQRFAVLGISGGGPYAAAVAAALPDRVSAVALVSPVGPIAGVENPPRLDAMHQISFRLLPRIPGAISLVFRLFRQVALYAPSASVRLAAGRGLSADREIVADQVFANDLGRAFAVGLATSSRGPVIDMQLFAAPWDIDLKSIVCPAQIWIGEQDRNVPIAAVEALAGAIPSAQLTQLGPHGHYWIARNYPQILQWVALSAARN
jgi:pimeloyl-ACP methyl ester carboxylesterase